VSASRPGYYTGGEAGAISIQTDLVVHDLITNTDFVYDGDTQPGPTFTSSGSPMVHFRHTVTNKGNVPLTSLKLSDTIGGASGCTVPATLAVSQSFTCEYVYTVPLFPIGQQNNAGTVSGQSICGTTYSDTNNGYYFVKVF